MTQTVTIPTNQFENFERRLTSVEVAIKRLVNLFEVKPSNQIHKLSEKAEKKYLIELVEFLQEQEKNPTPGATSVDELMAQLEQI